MEKNEIYITNNFNKIEDFKKNREVTLLNTNNDDIKILLIWKEKTIIFSVVESQNAIDIDFSKYVLSDFLWKEIIIKEKKYIIISILSKEDFEDWVYKSSEHLAMETVNEFRWKWINNEMFKIKESIDWIIWKSVERLVSNIFILLKQWFKVVWKIDKNTGKEIPFKWQSFIEKLISIKIKKWDFEWRLDTSYIFKK